MITAMVIFFYLISCKFYDPFLKPILASKHIAYFTDTNYVFRKNVCRNLKSAHIQFLKFQDNCSTRDSFEVKSTVGDKIRLAFNKNTLKHKEIFIKKSDIKSRTISSPKYPEEYQVKKLGEIYMNIKKLPSLIVSIFSSEHKNVFSISQSILHDEIDPEEQLFELDNSHQAIIIGNLIFSINFLIDLEDNLPEEKISISSKKLLDLLIDNKANRNKSFLIIKSILENYLGKSYGQLIKDNDKILYLKNNNHKKIVSTYTIEKNDFLRKPSEIFHKKKLFMTLPELTKNFHNIAKNKHLRDQLIYAGYFKKENFNNQKVIYFNSNTPRHQILILYFVGQKYSIALATNRYNHTLQFSDVITRRLINGIQISTSE